MNIISFFTLNSKLSDFQKIINMIQYINYFFFQKLSNIYLSKISKYKEKYIFQDFIYENKWDPPNRKQGYYYINIYSTI